MRKFRELKKIIEHTTYNFTEILLPGEQFEPFQIEWKSGKLFVQIGQISLRASILQILTLMMIAP